MKFKYLEHTADVEYVAYGKSVEECFENAALALFDTTSYLEKLKGLKGKVTTVRVKDKAGNLDDLLWYFLQDILSQMDSRGLFGFEVTNLEIKHGKSSSISARIRSKGGSSSLAKSDVKGISRYDLGVKRGNKGFEAHVVLDV